jgi:hypothetical protein
MRTASINSRHVALTTISLPIESPFGFTVTTTREPANSGILPTVRYEAPKMRQQPVKRRSRQPLTKLPIAHLGANQSIMIRG